MINSSKFQLFLYKKRKRCYNTVRVGIDTYKKYKKEDIDEEYYL